MAGRLLLGIDLGASVIRVAEASRSGSGFAVARWAELPMPPDAYRDGQVIDPQAVGKALKEGLKVHLKSYPRQAALAVGGQAALVRRATLPRLKPRKLRELLETQGDSWIPFIREGATFEVMVVNPALNEREQEVLIVAVPNRLLSGFAVALKAAGLKLAAMEVDTLAIYRTALVRRAAPAEGVVAILQAEPDRVRLGLVDNGVLVAVRSLEALPGSAGVPDAFLADVRRSLELMLSRMAEPKPLAAMAVSASRLPPDHLIGPLERELQGNLAGQLAEGFSVRALVDERAPQGSDLAFGLSLVLSGAPKAMRLLPRPTIREERQQWISLACSLLLLTGAAGYAHFWQREAPRLEARQSTLERTLTQLNTDLQREQDVAAEEALVKRLEPLGAQLAKHDPLSTAYPGLKQLIPEGLAISTLTGAPPELSITGSAASPDLVSEFLQALADSPDFGTPVLQHSGAGAGAVTFLIHIDMVPRR